MARKYLGYLRQSQPTVFLSNQKLLIYTLHLDYVYLITYVCPPQDLELVTLTTDATPHQGVLYGAFAICFNEELEIWQNSPGTEDG